MPSTVFGSCLFLAHLINRLVSQTAITISHKAMRIFKIFKSFCEPLMRILYIYLIVRATMRIPRIDIRSICITAERFKSLGRICVNGLIRGLDPQIAIFISNISLYPLLLYYSSGKTRYLLPEHNQPAGWRNILLSPENLTMVILHLF